MINTVAQFFQTGGPMMWVILGVLALALAVMFERLCFYLRTASDNADALAADTASLVTDNDLQQALDQLGEDGGPARRLMRRAVEMAWEGQAAGGIRQAVEELALREMPRYDQRLNYLAMLANIATLAGLLGTIFGLQQSFSALALAGAADKAAVLAAGISQAMNTTAFGLMVAMPCLAVHARLSSLAAGRAADCDAAVVKLLNFFADRDRLANRGACRAAV
jgi:biopolymer transport protein ExbB